MPKLFSQVCLQGDNLMAKIPKVGWRTVHSINNVPADTIVSLAKQISPEYDDQLDELIPRVMEERGSPLGKEVVVDCETEDKKMESHTLPFVAVDEAQLEAIKKNFEGVIAMGKAAGFTQEEINIVFKATVEAYAQAADPSSDQAANVMQMNMANMMANAMGGQGGQDGDGQCQQQ